MNQALFRIDAHAHVFHRGLPLAPGRRYAPAHEAPLATYLDELDRYGLTHGLLVQPSFLGTDNSWLVTCLQEAQGRLRGVAVVEPGVSQTELAALERAGVVGIRLNLLQQDLPDLRAPQWRGLLSELKALHWFVEIQRGAADLALLAHQLIDAGLKVVVDHYGLPDPELGVMDAGFAALLTLGRTGRAYVKLSAPYRMGAQGEVFARQAWPLLREAFGLDHVMWGSDWPHTQFEATQSFGEALSFLTALSPDEAERAHILAAPRQLLRF